VVDVDDTFGRWMISRGMAAPYAKPSFLEDVFQEPEKKRGRPRKGD